MAITVHKTAPTAIVAAMVLICCWSSLELSEKHAADAPGAIPEIAASLLTPAVDAPSSRNPFRSAASPRAGELASRGDAISPPRATGAPGTELDARDAISGLDLSATYIRGKDRMAIINGRLYGVGDSLTLPGPSPDSCTIGGIEPQKVLVERRGQALELTYGDRLAQPKGASQAASGRGRRASNAAGTGTAQPSDSVSDPRPLPSVSDDHE